MNADYLNTVRLLLKVAPVALGSEVFALKGGTAINLFVRDLPRLSVDLDLVYRMHSDARDVALATIQSEIGQMASQLTAMGLLVEAAKNPQGDEVKLFVREGQYRIKVEINYVFRGTICPVEFSDSVHGFLRSFDCDGSCFWLSAQIDRKTLRLRISAES